MAEPTEPDLKELIKIFQAAIPYLRTVFAALKDASLKELNKTKPPVHEHDIKIVDVQRAVTRPLEPKVTLVLFGCKTCPYISAEEIQGDWTREKLQEALDASAAKDAESNEPGPCYGA